MATVKTYGIKRSDSAAVTGVKSINYNYQGATGELKLNADKPTTGFTCEEGVTISAKLDDGYSITSWYYAIQHSSGSWESQKTSTDESVYVVASQDGDVIYIRATVEKVTYYYASVTYTSDIGKITGDNPQTVTQTSSAAATLTSLPAPTLSGDDANRYIFNCWNYSSDYDSGSVAESTNFLVYPTTDGDDYTAVASWQDVSPTIYVVVPSEGVNSITLNGTTYYSGTTGQDVTYGADSSLSVNVKDGYYFDQWYEGTSSSSMDTVFSYDNPCTYQFRSTWYITPKVTQIKFVSFTYTTDHGTVPGKNPDRQESGSTDMIEMIIKDAPTMSTTDKAKYNFKGWRLTGATTEYLYQPGQSFWAVPSVEGNYQTFVAKFDTELGAFIYVSSTDASGNITSKWTESTPYEWNGTAWIPLTTTIYKDNSTKWVTI